MCVGVLVGVVVLGVWVRVEAIEWDVEMELVFLEIVRA
jgi:hypothetical protein